MKLLFCTGCYDIFSLRRYLRYCACGESAGRYKDDLQAEVSGKAVPLGFHNQDFAEAIRNQPEEGAGERFIAFVIPKHCPTIKRRRHKYKEE